MVPIGIVRDRHICVRAPLQNVSPSLLIYNVWEVSGITIDYFGTSMKLSDLGQISVSDGSMILIQLWDKSAIEMVSKEIESSGIGINPSIDGDIIRLVVPPLTEERRRDLVKQVKIEIEKSKISCRNVRQKSNDELKRIGWRGEEPVGERKLHAFYELHIEQGPILEDENVDIGVVTHGQGLNWLQVTLVGKESHTGSTPMSKRVNAGLGMARITQLVDEIALSHAPHAVGAIGHIDVYPNSRNIIPGKVIFTVDFRHPNKEIIQDILASLIDSVFLTQATFSSFVDETWDSHGKSLAEKILTGSSNNYNGENAHEILRELYNQIVSESLTKDYPQFASLSEPLKNLDKVVRLLKTGEKEKAVKFVDDHSSNNNMTKSVSWAILICLGAVSYTHLTLPTKA